MLFNSVVFLKFFAAFLLLYYLVRGSLRARNILIVAASYLFYGWWDYRFLSLLVISSLLDYFAGLGIAGARSERRCQLWLGISLAGNLGMLGVFKYYGFFADSLLALMARIGVEVELRTLHIVLPVGISFYTFQTMSYTLDVWRRQIEPTRNLVNFLAYVSFFPQLVAGPIERASHLLPQFGQTRVITTAMLTEGVWLITWGMFKKVVVADNMAPLVELAFDSPSASGPVVILGVLAFGLQIYGDFSGYSDLARGLARVLGFDIMVNFNLPYLAADLRDFWRRWHISLSSWLRDYLYISLGGNRRGASRTCVNVLLTMLLGGLWHGAALNFVLWGLWHGLGLLAQRGWQRVRPTWLELPRPLAWALTMLSVFYGWLLFRAGSLDRILAMTSSMANIDCPRWIGSYVVNLLVFAAPLVLVQLWQARTGESLAPLRLPSSSRHALEGGLVICILLFWEKSSMPFIYFQF